MILAGLLGPSRHRRDDARADRLRDLNSLGDLFVGDPHPLRDREVADRSRLAVLRQRYRNVDKFLGLGVEDARGMR